VNALGKGIVHAVPCSGPLTKFLWEGFFLFECGISSVFISVDNLILAHSKVASRQSAISAIVNLILLSSAGVRATLVTEG